MNMENWITFYAPLDAIVVKDALSAEDGQPYWRQRHVQLLAWRLVWTEDLYQEIRYLTVHGKEIRGCQFPDKPGPGTGIDAYFWRLENRSGSQL